MEQSGFSANLGFLFADRPLADAIRASLAAGFSAVECHEPYDTPAVELRRALEETGLPLLGLNTPMGPPGTFGYAARREEFARARLGIQQALAYAREVGAKAVQVLSGKAEGEDARACFIENLTFACEFAEADGIKILIEPLNSHDVPGYFLTTVEQAAEICAAVNHPALCINFDCYHIQMEHGNLLETFRKHRELVGHVQFAQVPGRGEPVAGELNFPFIFDQMRAAGFATPFGAEYRPEGDTVASLDWLKLKWGMCL